MLAVVLVGLAQAAAILIALGLAWRTPDVREAARPDVAVAEADGGPADDATPHAIRSPGRVDFTAEFDASCVMVIHLDRTSGRVEEITPPEMNVGSDIGMVITNEMEGIATPRVAAQ